MKCSICHKEGHKRNNKKFHTEHEKKDTKVKEKKSRGKTSFASGKTYQEYICNRLKRILINDKSYSILQVEGAKAGADIVIVHDDTNIGLECKNKGAFEGGAKKLYFNGKKYLFEENSLHQLLLGDTIIYSNINLPYYEGKKTLEDYNKVKEIFNKDIYIDIDKLAIANYYKSSNVYYIQIQGYGLYHTGNDILKLDVPLFVCSELKMRIRTSKHKTKEGIPTDVTGALQYNKKYLSKSNFDLDNILPVSMKLMEE
jgi:hypothetical protein